MKDWKELNIDQLPSDIAVDGKYEFRWNGEGQDNSHIFTSVKNSDKTNNYTGTIFTILQHSCLPMVTLEYRERHEKAPTHEEIMTKWFHEGTGNWQRITAYCPDEETTKYRIGSSWVSIGYLTGLPIADIPPEFKP